MANKTFQELKGFRTLYPKDMKKYNIIEEIFNKNAQLFGYGRVEPPSLEYGKVLTAKGGLSPEQNKELFIFKDHGNRWIGLRFDLTTPIARIVANNFDLAKKMPLRWYYFTKMWRYEQPQKGRYREFWQFGIELIGSDSAEADAEVVMLNSKNITQLGFKSNVIKTFISHRDLLRGILKHYGIERDDTIVDIIRILDKKGKMPDEAIIDEIFNFSGRDKNLRSICKEILKQKPDTFDSVYEGFLSKVEHYNDLTMNAVSTIRDIFSSLKMSTTDEEFDSFVVDVSLARGFDYYTGFVFETYLMRDQNKVGGSLAGGGRYDKLIELFGGRETPAVGFAMGADRIIEALEDSGNDKIFKSLRTGSEVHVVFDIKNKYQTQEAHRIRNRLLHNGINSSMTVRAYSNFRKILEKELKFADTNNARYAIIVDDKTNDDNIAVKFLNKKEQRNMSLEEFLSIRSVP